GVRMRRLLTYLLAVLVMAATVGAAPAADTPKIAAATSFPKQFKKAPLSSSKQKARMLKPYQVGTASWYGKQFHGKTTASGEPFDMYQFTAAHLTLPLGTYVQVTNLRNGRTVVVRINDRGPVIDGRIIDVSYNVARALDFKSQG